MHELWASPFYVITIRERKRCSRSQMKDKVKTNSCCLFRLWYRNLMLTKTQQTMLWTGFRHSPKQDKALQPPTEEPSQTVHRVYAHYMDT